MIAVDMIDYASKAGTLSMQALLLLGLIILGYVIRSMHRENLARQTDFMNKIEAKEAAMSLERRDRITMLVGLIKDDVEVKQKLAGAVDNNTKAITDLESFISEQVIITRDLIKEINGHGRRK